VKTLSSNPSTPNERKQGSLHFEIHLCSISSVVLKFLEMNLVISFPLVLLEFEFKASYLLSRHSIH
jgi:hypothetical protein